MWTCRELVADQNTTCVPGHGAIADNDRIHQYVDMLDNVEEAARKAYAWAKELAG